METESTQLQPTIGVSDSSFRLIATYAGIAGLMPLIPVPFIDDVIIEHVHRRLYQKLATAHGFYLGTTEAKTLTEEKSNFFSGLFKSIIIWPVKKILKKVVYILSIKSCADVAAEVFHEGWSMARILEEHYIDTTKLAAGDIETLHALRDAIVHANKSVDPNVTRQAMRTAFGVSRELARPVLSTLGTFFKTKDDADLDRAEVAASGLATTIQNEISTHWDLSPKLDAALRQSLRVDTNP